MAPKDDIRSSLLNADEIGDPAETAGPRRHRGGHHRGGGEGQGFPRGLPGPEATGTGILSDTPDVFGGLPFLEDLSGDLDEEIRRGRPITKRHVHEFARKAIKRDRKHSPYRGRAWELHSRVLEHFRARHGRDAEFVTQPGEYWSTAEVIFNIDGDTGLATASVEKGTDFEAFTEYLGQNNAIRMGQNYTTTTADTNLSHPSQLTYVDEVFMITDISARFGGLRVAYNPADITGLNLGNGHLANMVSGKTEVWDQQGLILPKDFFDDFTGELLLLNILRGGLIVSFKWTDMGAGGNAQVKTVVVDTFENIPLHGVRSLKKTSGGARTHGCNEGYLWTLNNNFELSHDSGGNGLFTASLQVQNDIAMPFTPIALKGSKNRLVPLKIGVYIELRLGGIGYWAGNSPRQTSRHRNGRSRENVGERFRW